MNERLRRLAGIGQSVWIDSLSRDDIQNGNLERMIEDGVVGVTSNPTIFQKAISESSLYDGQLPDLAYDTLATVEEATRLHGLVNKPNLMVKIPATLPGLAAIEEMIAAGHSINVTLIFSLERYRAVTNAYIRGLQRLVAAGGTPSLVASVASFFVSRVDTEADKRLDEIGGHDDLKGELAVANARLAYQAYKEIFSGEDWEFLESKGATKQRPLWASTSTKNPEYGDVVYVEE